MPEEKAQRRVIDLLRAYSLTNNLVVKILLAVGLTLLIASMFPRGESIDLEYKVGTVWARKDLIAPFSFPVYRDEREYAADVERAKQAVYMVFERDTQLVDEALRKNRHVFGLLEEAGRLFQHYKRTLKGQRPSVRQDSARLAEIQSQLGIALSENEWEKIAQLSTSGSSPSLASVSLGGMQQDLDRVMRELFRVGILDRVRASLTQPEAAIRRGTMETIAPVSRLYDMIAVVDELEQTLQRLYPRDSVVAGIAYKIALAVTTPNLKFNRAATELATAAAVETVPRTLGIIQENERVVSKHERITPETKLKLESLRRALAERGPESDSALQFAGTVIHVSIVVVLYGIYLHLFRKRIAGNNRRLALIALLILMEGFLAYLTREINVAAPIEYLILVPAASMLLTIIFDSRVGFYGTVIIAFLVAGIRGNDYSVALASLVAGALSVYTVRDVKNRTQIFRSLGFIFLGYSLSIIALGAQRFESAGVIGEQLIFAFANAIFSPVLTYGLLVFFERVFGVVTDLTLIELSHFNHPLLKTLAEKAPGTYHHSLAIASLAEAAADAVGANIVLARVGAYFHDIGKLEKPTYFVENQKTSRNRHDKLAPRMSSLIIAAHVKDGMALAREHGLPEEVIDFIPQHHGTTLIEFFYNKALRLAENSPDETKIDEIKEQDYRYPGPKPQTKETGILMLADATEAAARTLEDPSPQRLEVVIDEVIKRRFAEGELDECPLTLKDLTRIKAAFLNVLIGSYHARVKYPEADKSKQGKQEQPSQPPDAPSAERLTRTIKEIDKL